MIKFFGLLSKKKKVKLDALVSIYCKTLDEVIFHGFVEIKDFINNEVDFSGEYPKEKNPPRIKYSPTTIAGGVGGVIK